MEQLQKDLLYYYELYCDAAEVDALSDLPELRKKVLSLASKMYYNSNVSPSKYIQEHSKKTSELLKVIQQYEERQGDNY